MTRNFPAEEKDGRLQQCQVGVVWASGTDSVASQIEWFMNVNYWLLMLIYAIKLKVKLMTIFMMMTLW